MVLLGRRTAGAAVIKPVAQYLDDASFTRADIPSAPLLISGQDQRRAGFDRAVFLPLLMTFGHGPDEAALGGDESRDEKKSRSTNLPVRCLSARSFDKKYHSLKFGRAWKRSVRQLIA
jgi:hypothetical protein